jgi:hypothetical protein
LKQSKALPLTVTVLVGGVNVVFELRGIFEAVEIAKLV